MKKLLHQDTIADIRHLLQTPGPEPGMWAWHSGTIRLLVTQRAANCCGCGRLLPTRTRALFVLPMAPTPTARGRYLHLDSCDSPAVNRRHLNVAAYLKDPKAVLFAMKELDRAFARALRAAGGTPDVKVLEDERQTLRDSISYLEVLIDELSR
jgi:hypothetical protein